MLLSDFRPYLLPLLGLAVAAILWFVVRPLIGSVSGWDDLAKAYGIDELPSGERFRSASAAVDNGPVPVRFRNILNVVVNPAGFGLSIQSVVGKAPTIFVPWAQVQSVTGSRALFGVEAAVIRIRGQWPVISLYGPAGAAVLQHYRH
jgi:hypothetical protein